jgi:DNA repair protein RadC
LVDSYKIILVHNHPGGDSKPSKDDIEVTRRIKEMSEIIGIKLLDHVIIGENEYTSIVYR